MDRADLDLRVTRGVAAGKPHGPELGVAVGQSAGKKTVTEVLVGRAVPGHGIELGGHHDQPAAFSKDSGSCETVHEDEVPEHVYGKAQLIALRGPLAVDRRDAGIGDEDIDLPSVEELLDLSRRFCHRVQIGQVQRDEVHRGAVLSHLLRRNHMCGFHLAVPAFAGMRRSVERGK